MFSFKLPTLDSGAEGEGSRRGEAARTQANHAGRRAKNRPALLDRYALKLRAALVLERCVKLRAALVLPLAVSLRALEEIIHQFARGVIHLDVERFDAAREGVVRPHRRHGDEQSDGGRYESFRNSAGDGGQSGLLLGGDAVEGVDDADDRSEQSHEGGGGTDRGERAHAALQLGVHNRFGALQGALAGFDFLTGDFRGILMRLEFLEPGD